MALFTRDTRTNARARTLARTHAHTHARTHVHTRFMYTSDFSYFAGSSIGLRLGGTATRASRTVAKSSKSSAVQTVTP